MKESLGIIARACIPSGLAQELSDTETSNPETDLAGMEDGTDGRWKISLDGGTDVMTMLADYDADMDPLTKMALYHSHLTSKDLHGLLN